MAIAVEVGGEDGVDGGKLDHGGKALDAEAAVAFVECDNGGAEIECFYQRQLFSRRPGKVPGWSFWRSRRV